MLFFDYDRDTQHRRMFMTDYRNPANVKLISDLNVNDRYNDIGQPVTKMLPNGSNVIRQIGRRYFPDRHRSIAAGRPAVFPADEFEIAENRRDLPFGYGRLRIRRRGDR